MDTEDENERVAFEQRMKAAVHYTVGRICEEVAADQGVTFTKQFIAVLAEATYRQSIEMSTDLELFAKHGKRTIVNTDDVKLLVRKSSQMLTHIQTWIDKQQTANEAKKNKGKGKRTKQRIAGSDVTNTTEDSNY